MSISMCYPVIWCRRMTPIGLLKGFMKQMNSVVQFSVFHWQGTEIDPAICKVWENFFQPDNLKVLVKLPIKIEE